MTSHGAAHNMESAGFVKLPRAIFDHEIMCDDWHFRLYGWCLLKANYRPRHGLGIGQFQTGRFTGSSELNVTPSMFDRGLKRLEAWGLIKREPNSRNTVVTVCQFGTWEEQEQPERTASEQVDKQATEQVRDNAKRDLADSYDTQSLSSEQRANNERTAREQPANTIEEYKNIKNKNPPPPTSSQSWCDLPWTGEVEEEIYSLGVDRARDCVEKAVAAGCNETFVRSLVRYFRLHRDANGWGPGVLYERLKSASMWQDVERNWPAAKGDSTKPMRPTDAKRQRSALEEEHGATLKAMTDQELKDLVRSSGDRLLLDSLRPQVHGQSGDVTEKLLRIIAKQNLTTAGRSA